MTHVMAKGANISLAAAAVRAVLRWSAVPDAPDVDASALLLGGAGKVQSDLDFVFYNQPRHPSGVVRHLPKQRVPDAAEIADTVEVDLAKLPAWVDRVVLAGSVEPGTFHDVSGLRMLLYDAGGAAGGEPLAEFRVHGVEAVTALVCGELYRRDGGWKFRAVGQGYASGLSGLATDFGITVDDEAPEPGAAAEPAAEPAAPAVPPPPSGPPSTPPHGATAVPAPTAQPQAAQPIAQPQAAQPNLQPQPQPQAQAQATQPHAGPALPPPPAAPPTVPLSVSTQPGVPAPPATAPTPTAVAAEYAYPPSQPAQQPTHQPTQPGYGYPQQQPGYGYPQTMQPQQTQPPQPGYGYPPAPPQAPGVPGVPGVPPQPAPVVDPNFALPPQGPQFQPR
ncbi:TerD family protein [Kitasatospora sp. RB6PN24]|uniref:TerD family protein n=1 Tax=Kitasatospora humi TaxID=2893891 RepID=UPI001E411927|nr:TerD family protein [Kitasatospora humi]MCC9310042.1 TerD family protein [Kitasatospora humi]